METIALFEVYPPAQGCIQVDGNKGWFRAIFPSHLNIWPDKELKERAKRIQCWMSFQEGPIQLLIVLSKITSVSQKGIS